MCIRDSPCVTRAVADGDGVTLGGLQARVMHVPGHTTGAISVSYTHLTLPTSDLV